MPSFNYLISLLHLSYSLESFKFSKKAHFSLLHTRCDYMQLVLKGYSGMQKEYYSDIRSKLSSTKTSKQEDATEINFLRRLKTRRK